MSVWIIGDVHGCYDTFSALLAKLPANDKKCLVGDLIDRGPNSRAVIERVMKDGIDCVAGNHEYMMLAALRRKLNLDFEHPLEQREADRLWMNNGGYETMESFKVREENEQYSNDFFDIDTEIIDWMMKLPLFIEYNDEVNEDGLHLMVSHAGASKRSYNWKDPWDWDHGVLWSRDWYYTGKDAILKLDKTFQVIGHTPHPKNPFICKHFACIDMGTFQKKRLAALKFPEMEIVFQDYIEQERER